jgi:hypothetical protein
MAEKINDPIAKRAMLEIADNYEHIADRAKQRLHDSKAGP